MNETTQYIYRRYGRGGQYTEPFSQVSDRNPVHAFDDAIISGRLSDAPGSKNWAGNYMYMGTTRSGDHFKHIISRQYLHMDSFGRSVDGQALNGAPSPDPDETLAYGDSDD